MFMSSLVLSLPQGKNGSGFITGNFTFCSLSLDPLKSERDFRDDNFKTPPPRGKML